jgi:hypothetical protein
MPVRYLVIQESQINGRCLTLSCILLVKGQKIPILALLDSGCSAYGFINDRFVKQHKLTTKMLKHPRDIQMADGA